jgi:hypothetical protein
MVADFQLLLSLKVKIVAFFLPLDNQGEARILPLDPQGEGIYGGQSE